jgi:hypothetical protein
MAAILSKSVIIDSLFVLTQLASIKETKFGFNEAK